MDGQLKVAGEGGVELDTDPGRLDVDRVFRWLSEESYWAAGRSREVIERSIAGSLVFGVYLAGEQIGYARVVTDGATFAWLCDVFIDGCARGRGLGSWLVRTILDHVEGTLGINRVLLATKDAHSIYERIGFTPLAAPERWMERDRRAAR